MLFEFFFLLCKWFSFHSPLSDFWFLFLLIQIIFVFTNYYNLHVFCLSWFRFVCAVFTSYLKKQSVSVVADCLYMFFSLTIMWLGRCSFAYWLAFLFCVHSYFEVGISELVRKWINLLCPDWLLQTSSARRSSATLRNVRKCVRSITSKHSQKLFTTHTIYENERTSEWLCAISRIYVIT